MHNNDNIDILEELFVELLSDISIEEPKKYKVLFHNDDVTTMDFVIFLLMHLFDKTRAQAHELAINIDSIGVGIVGIFSKEIAETKTVESISIARTNNFPLRVSFEEL